MIDVLKESIYLDVQGIYLLIHLMSEEKLYVAVEVVLINAKLHQTLILKVRRTQ